MSINTNSGSTPDPNDPYAGYGGYQAARPAENPSVSSGQSSSMGSQGSDPDYAYGHAQQGQQTYSSAGQQQQQQYASGQSGSNAYVPPDSVTRRSGANQGAFLSQRERRNALLSYLGFCFTGIVFFFFNRKSTFVRFHAAQSVVVFTPLIGAYLLLKFLSIIPVIGFLLSLPLSCLTGLVLLAMAGFWIFFMITSYRGSTVRLPFISDYTQALVDRFSKP